ncbi:hypothetical protein [Lentilactobacillus sp. SPB1-3]|uniref:Uncharacterized protein n=1 Tax=Lentilactobacillus terminaliae TaxID=3003483 RepID=A0ACD5DDB7_9LACO|nr:hypothetical protein [Lentilactobacillus sp. SPB1-3]MCZ0978004.1 hypothetical protein [Lentilactobacillus sp. SPB1-3]
MLEILSELLYRGFIFFVCFMIFGGLALVVEHRKELFDFPKFKDIWEELTDDFFGTK